MDDRTSNSETKPQPIATCFGCGQVFYLDPWGRLPQHFHQLSHTHRYECIGSGAKP